MRRNRLILVILSWALLVSAYPACAQLAIPFRIGGTVTVDGKQLTAADDVLIRVTNLSGVVYEAAEGASAEVTRLRDDGFYILDVPMKNANQPKGASTGETAVLHVFVNGAQVQLISPVDGRFEVGSAGESRQINLHVLGSSPSPACTLGGKDNGSIVTGTVSAAQCPAFVLSLSRRPPVTAEGRLYIGLQVLSIPAWASLVWFRPSENNVPPYIRVVKNEPGFLPGAEDYYFIRGTLPDTAEDLSFRIGTEGLEGQTLVFRTLYLEENQAFGEESLSTIQQVTVNFQ